MKIEDRIRSFTNQSKPQPDKIALKYFQKYPNSGDVFSMKLAQTYFFDHQIIPVRPAQKGVNISLMLLGSILQRADSHTVVCGAGFMFSDGTVAEKPKAVVCVRGPLSGDLLDKQGINHPEKYADPGVMAPFIFTNKTPVTHKIGIIPHYKDLKHTWIKSCKKQGCNIINVFTPLPLFFKQIQQCEIILSSSLHGIIFAHAYGKPALWIELSNKVAGNGFKFYDYYASVGLKPDVVQRIWIEEKTNPFEISNLSRPADHSDLRETMMESLAMVKENFTSRK
jgi:pyruvyltransferase